MKLIIIGAGAFGHTIMDIASQNSDYSEIHFLDDNFNTQSGNIVGKCADFTNYINENTVFFPAFGNNKTRYEWNKRLLDADALVATIIHPTAYISPTAVVGIGSAILPKAIINTNVVVGDACIVNIGAIIDHDNILNDGVHIAPGAIVKGENQIAAFSKIDSGIVITNRTYPISTY